MDTERLINMFVVLSIFGLVFSVWCICIFLWLGQYLIRLKSVQKKLGIVKKETEEARTLRLWRETNRESRGVLPAKVTFIQRLKSLQHAAGWQVPGHIVMLRGIGVTLLSFIITYLCGGGVIWGLVVSITIVIAFWYYTNMRISKNTALFDRQLVDALGLSARGLRAGLPLTGSFQLISDEIDKPVGDIFYQICQKQMLGLDMKDSMRKVAQSVNNPELKLFATAVAIQLQSGGNLADLMDSLANVIRVRMRLKRRIRVITSQTQFSKRVLIALPIILFLVLNIISPEYMALFYTTTSGKYMLAIMITMLLFGIWVMNRLAVLRF